MRYAIFLSIVFLYLISEVQSPDSKVNYEGDTESVNDYEAKVLAKKRILNDRQQHINRRKRYSYVGKDGKLYYTHRVVPCITYYKTCVPCCKTRQPNQSSTPRYPTRTYYTTRPPLNTYKSTTSIYEGPARNWTGPTSGCKCNIKGSEIFTCDIITGQCRCKPHYIGRTCDKCEDEYWNSPSGCQLCDCNIDGSESHNCDQDVGNCLCKPGVQGQKCNSCKPGYYGFSATGCKECDVCNKVGHICDPDTGRCVCPPNSYGEKCHLCKINTWGHEPNNGCRSCNCSDTGSLRSQCNAQTGVCFCLQGYTGVKCDRCEHGYYGYPKCRRCSCNYAGTDKDLGNCETNGICQCNDEGLCPCKTNVSGKRCNHCKDGTFGLHMENYNGCTQCFCFGRSTYCKESGYTWGKIRGQNRSLTIDFMDSYKKNRKITSNDVLTINNFEIIEDSPEDITRSHDHFDIPLFWKLPEKFTGDRLLSYGGYLRFSIDTYGARKPKNVIFKQFPLVRIEGNGVKLYYEVPASKINKHFEIKIHENFWKSEHAVNNAASRDLIMLTLQNISGIYIKATDYSSFEKIILRDVSWDTAIDVPGSPPPITVGVEKCDCPAEYSGTSCQNPNKGFSRYKTQHPHIVGTTFNSEMIDAIIGRSIPCQCNNRSSVCDIETGECLNCTENTSGKSCEHCAEGFYGDPMLPEGKCEACACPSPTQNFAISCTPNPRSNYFICKCKKGYIGPSCDRCSPGYYGQPQLPGGNCKPCNCNKDGRINNECDQITGHCNCKSGITGSKCSQCEKSRHVLENKQCIPCDNCTIILLDKLDNMINELMQNTSHLQGGALQPPWETLEKFNQRYLKLEGDYDDYLDSRDKLTALIDTRQVEIFEKEADSLSNLYKERKHNLEMNKKKAKENAEKVQELSINISKTRDELTRLIKTLKDFGKSPISTKDAVHKANELLIEIKTQYSKVKNVPSQFQTLKECKKVYDYVEKIAQTKYTDPLKIRKDLVDLSRRLFDLEKILNSIKQNNTKLQEKNFNNEEKYVKIKEDLEDATKLANNINKVYVEKRKSLDDSFKLLETVKANYDSFIVIRNELDELTQRMEEKELMLDEGIELLENYKTQLEDHTKNLEKNVSDYKDAFHGFIGTKELNAVNASGRFNEIITGLQEVNDSLIETKKDFNRLLITTIKPDNRDSIYDNTSIAIADSERLVTRVKNLKNQLPGFNERFNKLYGFMETLKSKNWENGLKNNNKTDKIIQLKHKIKNTDKMFTSLENTLKDAVAQSDAMRKIYKDAANINISMQYVIVKNFQKYLNLTSSTNIKNLQKEIKVTKELLQNITSYGGQTNIDIIKKMNKALGKFKDTKSSIDVKIQNLSSLIKKANQISSVIRVPLNGINCSRSYRLPHLEPTTITNITVHFTSNGLDGGLLYISNGEQYMFLRVDNKRIGFSWKFLNQDYHLWAEDTIEEEQELNIFIERINNIMKVRVNTQEYSKIMDEKLTLFNISSSNLLRVGTNDNHRVIGLPGCLKDIIFNTHPVGLWQFEETIGSCSGCNRNNTITSARVKYIFKGEGYITDTETSGINPIGISIKFKISTFDENALLFLAHHDKTYMSIQIKNGYIQCGTHYLDGRIQPLIVQDNKISNNGSEVSIECTKTYNKARTKEDIQLTVNNVITNDTYIISSKDILKIKKAVLYYGGVPPDFPIDNLRDKSFLGLMSEIFISKPLSLQNTQFYGVELFTENYVSYKRILFDSNGYVKLKKNIQHLSELNFVLRTESEDGLIMQLDQEEITFILKNGKIVVESMKTPILYSIGKVNNNEYHLIQLKKYKKHFILYVNGDEQGKYEIKHSKQSSDKHEILIGGYENRISNKFRGTIQDITYTDKNTNASYLYINHLTYVSSKGAKIGRSNPSIKRYVELTLKKSDEKIALSENDSLKDMQKTEGCDKISYNLEPNAVKFGDAPNSFVQHNLKDSFWKTDFSIEFEFRTFYRDGLLFIAFGAKDHYNMLEIKDGRVVLHIKGKRNKKLPFGANIDDGNWHHISIQHSARQKRKLSIILDGELRKAKVPQNKVNGRLFFGDWYKSDSFVPISAHQINPFRGCIRSLKINNSTQGLINNKNTIHHNIGQCFPNIEKGSYFRGDSYAIYNNFFRLSNFLEVSFDFRTSEQNGIFLSISNIDNSPALSIELQNGAVVLSVDMGHGMVTNVTNNLSKYTICNNKWHHVRATFSTELTVNVDGVSQSWVLSDMGLLEQIEAPLYVGGLPDSAPGGTLKVRENFKGCIHNLMIGNKNLDWINMDELNNVSLNSCPVML